LIAKRSGASKGVTEPQGDGTSGMDVAGLKQGDLLLKVFLLRLGLGGVGKFFTFFKKCV
jgi:hypothetical protein